MYTFKKYINEYANIVRKSSRNKVINHFSLAFHIMMFKKKNLRTRYLITAKYNDRS